MANKSVGLLTIAFGADLRGFEKAMKKAQKSIKKFGSSMKQTGKNLTRNLTLPLVALGAASIRNFDIQAKAIAQVEAGLKSTGNQVGKTSKQLQKMAADLQTKTLFGDEEILKNATAQLLTFTNIAGNQFDKTQEIALDLATRLDGDLKSASIMLGKALNDPVANLSALSRAGIQFSKEQKDLVKSLVETNRLADAQTIILAELEKQYGGSAEAAAKAGAGPLQQLSNQLSDISEDIGQLLLPILIEMGNKIKNIALGFTNLDEDTKKVIVTIGILAGAIGPLLLVVGQLTIAFAALFSPGGAVLVGIIALAAGFVFISENFEAMKERLSDWSWWKNSLINAAKQAVLVFGGPMASALGITQAVLKIKQDTGEYEHEFGTFAEAIKAKAEDLSDVLLDLGKSFGLGGSGGGKKPEKSSTTNISSSVQSPAEQLGIEGDELNLDMGSPDWLFEFGEGFDFVNEKITKTKSLIGELNDIFTLTDETLILMGEQLGATFLQGAENMKEFAKSTKAAIKEAIAAVLALAVANAVQKAMESMPAFPGSVFLIPAIAGLAGGLAKSAFNSLIPAFAEGGLVSGPTLSLIGEGAGTSASNPEVVAPLDKLKGMINNNGGGGKVEVYGRISGNDIFISNQRGSINRQRSV